MLERFKRTIRRMVVKKGETEGRDRAARVPEKPQPGPAPPDEARPETEASGDFAVPVTKKERRHDGWGPIRPRRPGEDTDMGRDLIPDITDPGPDLGENRR